MREYKEKAPNWCLFLCLSLFSQDVEASFASAEDIVLKKLVFYEQGDSEKHLRDIAGIIKVSRDNLDFDYLLEWAEKLQVSAVWAKILGELGINDTSPNEK